MYLDKLDGEVEEASYRKYMKKWREDQKRLQRQIEGHQEADENYIEQGIRLIGIARNAYAFFQSKDQPKRAELIRFIFPNSNLSDGKVVPVFKPPFDIIWKLAKEARKSKPVNKKQAASEPAACPIALPDRTRTPVLWRRGSSGKSFTTQTGSEKTSSSDLLRQHASNSVSVAVLIVSLALEKSQYSLLGRLQPVLRCSFTFKDPRDLLP